MSLTGIKIQKVERREREAPDGWDRRKMREYNAKARVYFHIIGETILENLMERRFRPVAAFRALMPEVLRQAGLPADTKVSWSQYAGCSCPCSPGFIIKDHTRFDVLVDVLIEKAAEPAQPSV